MWHHRGECHKLYIYIHVINVIVDNITTIVITTYMNIINIIIHINLNGMMKTYFYMLNDSIIEGGLCGEWC